MTDVSSVFYLFDDDPISYNNGKPSLTVTSTASGFVNPLSNYAVITLQIWMPHTYSGDCTVTLMSPSGTTIYITNRRGGSAANVFNGTYFTDSAADSVATYSFSSNSVASPLKPESPFSTFRGENPNGKWVVTFYDMASGDNGKLSEMLLVFQGKNIKSIKKIKNKKIKMAYRWLFTGESLWIRNLRGNWLNNSYLHLSYWV
mgnify:CR=1 FL=1